MLKRGVVILGIVSLVSLTGCDAMRTAAQSKANQGAVLGGLLGTGIGALIGSVSDHHRGLGMWAGGAGAVGALGGWLLGHTMEDHQERKIQ